MEQLGGCCSEERVESSRTGSGVAAASGFLLPAALGASIPKSEQRYQEQHACLRLQNLAQRLRLLVRVAGGQELYTAEQMKSCIWESAIRPSRARGHVLFE